MLTYAFKIKPTPILIQKFEEHLNTTRMLYNLAKETKEYAYSKGLRLSKFDLIKQLPELKNEFTWMKEVNAQTLQGIIERLYRSYDKFFTDLKSGVTTNKPKWAKKKGWKSVEFKQGNAKRSNPELRFIKDNLFNLPKIGKIKIFKSREVNGNIKLARIVKKADGWYLQIVTDYEIQKCDNQAEVGIDLGITQFAVTSNGQFFENIKTSEKYAKQLRAEQKSLSRKKKFSKNFYKQVVVIKKLYLKIQRTREDYLHKVSRELASGYQTVFVEDLGVKQLLENKNYSKAILDVSWGKFINYLEYKTNVVKVNPAYTSQKCSKCGHTCKENRKTQSLFECVKCGYTENADLQATFNILQRGQSLMEAKTNR